jgi:hypothetical protein
MRQRNREAGNILLLTGLALTALMGFAGLAVDMGMLRYDKRLQQTAADAAALAGASNLAYSGWQAGGQNAAAANLFTDSSGNTLATCTGAAIGTVCVEIDSPPVDGPHAGQAGCSPAPSCYVEARVAEVWPTYFMNLLAIPSQMMVARAVATSVSGGSPGGGGCVYTIGPPAKGIGININGSATLNATSCGIVDNGNFTSMGNALRVKAGSFGVSGSWTDKGTSLSDVTCTSGQTNCPETNTPAGPNPLASLTPPCNPCTGGASASGTTFNPGTYSSISINSNGTVTFNPGIYILTGSGISCSGTPTITGNGVMFYFAGTGSTGATFNCQGNDTLNLTAPTASNCSSCPSQYDGILMYQEVGNTNGPSVGGNVGSQYNGVLYFPSSDVTFFGNSSTNLCNNSSQVLNVGEVVSNSINFSGNPTICMEGPVGLQNKGVTVSNTATALLVE